MLRHHRRQRAKRQPALERPGYPSALVPSHDAKAADASGARSHSESSAITLDNSRRKKLKQQRALLWMGRNSHHPKLSITPRCLPPVPCSCSCQCHRTLTRALSHTEGLGSNVHRHVALRAHASDRDLPAQIPICRAYLRLGS
jgi:hypothetical protein